MKSNNVDSFYRPIGAPISRDDGRVLQVQQMNRNQYNPLAEPNFQSKGTVQTTLGGITTFKDINGGTLLTYNPKTGTITIYGGVIQQQNVQIGTLSNSILSGTTTNLGTVTGGLMTPGTVLSVLKGTASDVTGAFVNPILGGTLALTVSAGSGGLTSDGSFQLQTFGSAANLVFSLGGTNFRINPTGTI